MTTGDPRAVVRRTSGGDVLRPLYVERVGKDVDIIDRMERL